MDVGLGVAAIRECVAVARTGGRYLLGLVRAGAFWGTVLLPAVIVGALVTGVAVSTPLYLAVLVGLNVLCILLGRRYPPEE